MYCERGGDGFREGGEVGGCLRGAEVGVKVEVALGEAWGLVVPYEGNKIDCFLFV